MRAVETMAKHGVVGYHLENALAPADEVLMEHPCRPLALADGVVRLGLAFKYPDVARLRQNRLGPLRPQTQTHTHTHVPYNAQNTKERQSNTHTHARVRAHTHKHTRQTGHCAQIQSTGFCYKTGYVRSVRWWRGLITGFAQKRTLRRCGSTRTDAEKRESVCV
eukprot:COSAG05_NODE_1010_length_6207_cov_3.771447_7_plen_164_part_00